MTAQTDSSFIQTVTRGLVATLLAAELIGCGGSGQTAPKTRETTKRVVRYFNGSEMFRYDNMQLVKSPSGIAYFHGRNLCGNCHDPSPALVPRDSTHQYGRISWINARPKSSIKLCEVDSSNQDGRTLIRYLKDEKWVGTSSPTGTEIDIAPYNP